MTRLTFRHGLEITFHGWLEDPVRRRINLAIRARCAKEGWTGGYPGVHRDSDATVEFTSPLLTTLDQVEHYYTYVRGIARSQGWPIRHPHWTSGGGHISVSRRGWSRWTNAAHDLEQRHDDFIGSCRAVAWAFNDPECDEWSSNVHSDTYHPLHNGDVGWSMTATQRLELRWFRAPFNVAEQLLHCQFADRLLDHLRRRGRAGLPRGVPLSTDPLLAPFPTPPLKLAKTMLGETIEALGFPQKPFAKFFTNLERRYTWRRAYHAAA